MKKRLVIAVVLSLIMLVTLATPVLADREAGELDNVFGEPGTGKAVVQTTHDNYVKVMVSIKRARFNHTYDVYLQYDYPESTNFKIGEITTNKRGSGRFSTVTGRESGSTWPSSSDVNFKVHLRIGGDNKFFTGFMGLHFK